MSIGAPVATAITPYKQKFFGSFFQKRTASFGLPLCHLENQPRWMQVKTMNNAQARRTIRSIKAFYLHLTIFTAVIALLFTINVITGGVWWVQWPFLGWGIGVTAHAAATFGAIGWMSRDWEERKIAELLARYNLTQKAGAEE